MAVKTRPVTEEVDLQRRGAILSPRERERLDTLRRRIDHLSRRIANSDRDLSWDKSELAALRWAVSWIEHWS